MKVATQYPIVVKRRLTYGERRRLQARMRARPLMVKRPVFPVFDHSRITITGKGADVEDRFVGEKWPRRFGWFTWRRPLGWTRGDWLRGGPLESEAAQREYMQRVEVELASYYGAEA